MFLRDNFVGLRFRAETKRLFVAQNGPLGKLVKPVISDGLVRLTRWTGPHNVVGPFEASRLCYPIIAGDFGTGACGGCS